MALHLRRIPSCGADEADTHNAVNLEIDDRATARPLNHHYGHLSSIRGIPCREDEAAYLGDNILERL